MKKLLAIIFAAFALSASAAPFDLIIQQLSEDGTEPIPRLVQKPATGNGIVYYDAATMWPSQASLSSHLQISSGVLGLTFTPFPGTFAALTGKPTTLSGYGITDAYPLAGNPSGFITSAALAPYLTTAAAASTYATQAALTSGLATKFNTPTGTTAQYVRGDGSLANLPVTPARSFSYPTRALNTCFQVSATRDARVSYSVDITVSVTLGGTPRGYAYLRTYTDSACTAGQQTVVSGSSGMPSTLAVVVGLQNLGTISLPATIPAGLWARIETVNDSGAPVFAARQGQEVLE